MAVKLPEGFVLDQSTSQNNAPNLPQGFVLDQPSSNVENPVNIRIPGPAPLSQNIPVQFGRGAQDAVESIPHGTQVEGLIQKTSPLINLLKLIPLIKQMGQQYGQDVQNAPPAQGILPNISRFAGNATAYSGAAAPFIAGSEALPAIPAVSGVASKLPGLARLVETANSPLGRTALGIGGFEGTKKVVEGKPLEAPGEFAKGTALTYAGGKAFELGGKAIQGSVKALGKAPAVIVNSLIKPLLKDFSYGKNPGRTVAAEGVIGNTLDELGANITSKRQEIGQKINNLLSLPKNSSKRLDLTGALKPVNDAIAEAKKYPKTNSELIKRLQNTLDDISNRITGPKNARLANINQKLGSFSPLDATSLKTEIGDITKWTGNASDDKIVNKALKQVYGFIKQKIGGAVQEVKLLNEKYADLLSAEIATKYRDKINSRQNMLSVVPRMLGGGAAIGGLITGNPKLIAAAITEIGAEKILGSPAFKTRVASALARIPFEEAVRIVEANPFLKKIPAIAARVTAATFTKKSVQK